jgi:hypothetical protein
VMVAGRPWAYDQALVRTDDGALELRTDTASLRVEVAAGRITVDAPSNGLGLQLVTTYGLPLMLERPDVLVLHASCGVPPGGDGAVVVCARSGTGKSTLLLGLLDAGWQAVAEDVCAIDLREDRPRVWPGPPWLRRAGRGPAGSRSLYELPDKNAWDISATQVEGPVPVATVVFLDPAGGEEIRWTPVDRGSAIAGLTASAIWLSEPEQRAQRTFPGTAVVASRVPAARLRLPVSEDWAERAEAMIRDRVRGD